MANNIYMKISFVDSSIIISNYFINYYTIARYEVSSMINTKTSTHTSIGFYFITQEVGPVFLKSGLK